MGFCYLMTFKDIRPGNLIIYPRFLKISIQNFNPFLLIPKLKIETKKFKSLSRNLISCSGINYWKFFKESPLF